MTDYHTYSINATGMEQQTKTMSTRSTLRMFFLTLELRLLKFKLNSSLVYIIDRQRQQISFALYSRQPECSTTQVARHCLPASTACHLLKLLKCVPTERAFNSHAAPSDQRFAVRFSDVTLAASISSVFKLNPLN